MNKEYFDVFNYKELISTNNDTLTGNNIKFFDEDFTVNKYLSIPKGSFLIRVFGDSMKGAGIASGDMLVVENTGLKALGKIIIAEINRKITLKRFVKINDEYYLKPENPKYDLIKIKDHRNFKIWGIATKVIKNVTDRIG